MLLSTSAAAVFEDIASLRTPINHLDPLGCREDVREAKDVQAGTAEACDSRDSHNGKAESSQCECIHFKFCEHTAPFFFLFIFVHPFLHSSHVYTGLSTYVSLRFFAIRLSDFTNP